MPLADAALDALKETKFFSEEALGHIANSSDFLTKVSKQTCGDARQEYLLY
jgi:hypothetical protein